MHSTVSPTNGSSANSSISQYQQPVQQHAPVNIANVVIFCILIPLIVVGNMLVCVVFIKYKRIRTATNCFIFSLAISDLAVGLFLVPFWITLSYTRFGSAPTLITLSQVLDITCSVASMANLASVSVERWYGVVYPFLHMRVSPKKASIMAACSWLYALIIALLYLIQTPAFLIIIIVMGLLLPFLVMLASYTAIAVKIRRRAKAHPAHDGREWKTVRTLLIITAVFLICYLPLIIGSIVAVYCKPCVHYVHQRPLLHNFPKILHYANSFINPILYAMFSPSLRSGFKHLFAGARKTRSGNATWQYRHERLSQEPSSTAGVSMTRRSNFIDWNTVAKRPSMQNYNKDNVMGAAAFEPSPMQNSNRDTNMATANRPLMQNNNTDKTMAAIAVNVSPMHENTDKTMKPILANQPLIENNTYDIMETNTDMMGQDRESYV